MCFANIDCKYRHHAQLGQIHHAIYYYGKDICDYMIFCDLDEYLFIPNNSIIEFNGSQHYIPVERFGGEEGLKKVKRNDRIKTKYCKENNIILTNSYSNTNRNTKIEGKCLTENCQHIFNKVFNFIFFIIGKPIRMSNVYFFTNFCNFCFSNLVFTS